MTGEVRRLIALVSITLGAMFLVTNLIRLAGDGSDPPVGGFALGGYGVVAGVAGLLGRGGTVGGQDPPLRRPPARQYLTLYLTSLLAGVGILVAGVVKGGADLVFMAIFAFFPLTLGLAGLARIVSQRNGRP